MAGFSAPCTSMCLEQDTEPQIAPDVCVGSERNCFRWKCLWECVSKCVLAVHPHTEHWDRNEFLLSPPCIAFFPWIQPCHTPWLSDWTVRYTPPTHWHEWQLVFWTPSAWTVISHKAQKCLVSHCPNCEAFFPLSCRSQDAPHTVIWYWITCCVTAADWKRLIGVGVCHCTIRNKMFQQMLVPSRTLWL